MEDDNQPKVEQENREAARAFDGQTHYVGTRPESRRASWAWVTVLPLLACGLGLIAAAALVPAWEENRKLDYNRQAVGRELDFAKQQIETNKTFLRLIETDPQMALRLAMRQNPTLVHPDGTAVAGTTTRPGAMSPFEITAIAQPATMPAYKTNLPGAARWVLDPQRRGWVIGAGVFLVMASGVLLGVPTRRATGKTADTDQ
jgi:hypothetical protein